MRLKNGFLILLLFWAATAAAQFTTVSGTVTDPNGLPYAFGTIASVIVATNTPKIAATGTPYIQPTQATGLDGSGKFTLTLADNTALTPGSSTWTFTVCSGTGTVLPSFGKGPICFVVSGVTISGASQDIGATLRAAAPALTANFSSGGGTVTGSGTAGKFAEWTSSSALGNSPITDSGNILTSTEGFTLTTPNAGGLVLQGTSAPANCAGGAGAATFSLVLFNVGCKATLMSINPPAASSGIATGIYSSNSASATLSGTPAITGVYGVGNLVANSSSPNYLAGVAGFTSVSGITGTVANMAGVVGIANIASGGSQTATIMAGVDGQVQYTNAGGGATAQPFGAALYARSPLFAAAGGNPTISHIYGLYVDDQTVGGGTNNPDPHGLYVNGGGIQTKAVAFAALPACAAALEGRTDAVTDSSTNTWGATITNGGANHVLAYCNGTNWTVAAK